MTYLHNWQRILDSPVACWSWPTWPTFGCPSTWLVREFFPIHNIVRVPVICASSHLWFLNSPIGNCLSWKYPASGNLDKNKNHVVPFADTYQVSNVQNDLFTVCGRYAPFTRLWFGGAQFRIITWRRECGRIVLKGASTFCGMFYFFFILQPSGACQNTY